MVPVQPHLVLAATEVHDRGVDAHRGVDRRIRRRQVDVDCAGDFLGDLGGRIGIGHVDLNRTAARIRKAKHVPGLVVRIVELESDPGSFAIGDRELHSVGDPVARDDADGEGAADTDVVGAPFPFRTGKDEPHARVALVRGVEILIPPLITIHRLDVQVRVGLVEQVGVAEFVLVRLLGDRVVGPRQHVAVGVDQLDHGIQRVGGVVDVEPDFRAGRGVETVHVGVGRVVVADVTVRLEPKPPVVVAVGVFRGELAQVLGFLRRAVGVLVDAVRLLLLVDDRHVAIVAVPVEQHASPIAGGGHALRAVAVGVELRLIVQVESGPDRVVGQGSEDDRITGHAHDVEAAADPIVDFQRAARGREAGIVAPKLDHEAFAGTALERQPALVVVVGDDDLAAQHVDDVGIVPDRLGGQRLVADLDAVDAVVGHPVIAHERAVVVVVAVKGRKAARAPAPIGHDLRDQRVRVDADDRAVVVDEIVARDDRLRAAHENRRGLHGTAPVAGAPCAAAGVVLEPGVGDPGMRLLDLDRIEAGVPLAFDGRFAAGVGDDRLVDAGLRGGPEIQAGPIARSRRPLRVVGIVAVLGRVERSAGPVPVVFQRGEHDFVAGGPVDRAGASLGDELGADLRLDAAAVQLDDQAGIDPQARVGPRGERAGVVQRAEPLGGNHRPFEDQLDDIAQRHRVDADVEPLRGVRAVDRVIDGLGDFTRRVVLAEEDGGVPSRDHVDAVAQIELEDDLRAAVEDGERLAVEHSAGPGKRSGRRLDAVPVQQPQR